MAIEVAAAVIRQPLLVDKPHAIRGQNDGILFSVDFGRLGPMPLYRSAAV